MALSAATVWEFRTTGSDNNGGGFKTGASGTDYSQQDTAQLALTDLACLAASTTLTSATGGFTAAMIGNIIFIRSGTNFTAGFYEITAHTNTNTVTLDRTASNGSNATGGSGNVGGCRNLISANSFPQSTVAGNIVYIKSGTYVLGGTFTFTTGAATNSSQIIGYNTTRGDNPTGSTRPLINYGANIAQTGIGVNFSYLQFTGTQTSGFQALGHSRMMFCKFTSTSGTSTATAARTSLSSSTDQSEYFCCEFVAASAVGFKHAGGSGGGILVGCNIHGCVTGIELISNDNFSMFGCVSYANTTHVLVNGGNTATNIINNTFYGAETPTGTGIDYGGGDGSTTINNIFYGLTTAMTSASARTRHLFLNNNFFNNTTDRTNVQTGMGDTALNPQFVNAASQNFSIGANLKGLGFPGLLPATSSTGYMDIGAVQASGANEFSYVWAA